MPIARPAESHSITWSGSAASLSPVVDSTITCGMSIAQSSFELPSITDWIGGTFLAIRVGDSLADVQRNQLGRRFFSLESPAAQRLAAMRKVFGSRLEPAKWLE